MSSFSLLHFGLVVQKPFKYPHQFLYWVSLLLRLCGSSLSLDWFAVPRGVCQEVPHQLLPVLKDPCCVMCYREINKLKKNTEASLYRLFTLCFRWDESSYWRQFRHHRSWKRKQRTHELCCSEPWHLAQDLHGHQPFLLILELQINCRNWGRIFPFPG